MKFLNFEEDQTLPTENIVCHITKSSRNYHNVIESNPSSIIKSCLDINEIILFVSASRILYPQQKTKRKKKLSFPRKKVNSSEVSFN